MRLIDETGNHYGRLVVLSRNGSDYKGQAMWLCQCRCGNQTTVVGYSLRRGETKSCGCLADSLRLPEGEGAFNLLLSWYRYGAVRHGRVWELTREQVHSLTSCSCYYCGKPPSKVIRSCGSEYTYSGIDRKDNNLGYTEDNCVPCCVECNRAKWTKSVEQFKAQRKDLI